MMFVSGTRKFTKHVGYYGQPETCPNCGKTYSKALMINKNENQNFYYYAKHILKNKPTGVLTPDNSFEFWIKDVLTNEEFLIFANITKEQIKNIKKNMGIKNLNIIDIY